MRKIALESAIGGRFLEGAGKKPVCLRVVSGKPMKGDKYGSVLYVCLSKTLVIGFHRPNPLPEGGGSWFQSLTSAVQAKRFFYCIAYA